MKTTFFIYQTIWNTLPYSIRHSIFKTHLKNIHDLLFTIYRSIYYEYKSEKEIENRNPNLFSSSIMLHKAMRIAFSRLSCL